MVKIIEILNDLAATKKNHLREWVNSKYKNLAPFIYSSVDIRYSGSKIAPVDTNIFPAGFNNLSNSSKEKAGKLFVAYIKQYHPNTKNILLIPESHTRNLKYLENVCVLRDIFKNGGYNIEIAAFDASLDGLEVESESGNKVKFSAIERDGNRVKLKDGFNPDLIVVNNDMTIGSPEILQDIKQHIEPPIGMGWYQRTKYNNCLAYKKIASEFGKEFDVNPFLISAEFGFCKNINFKEKKGLDCIANEVEKTLFRIREKYKELNIHQDPYVFLKANRGTYGMGIMVLRSGEDIYNINKKSRNKMSVIKNNTTNAEILIQEGVETIVQHQGVAAEPFIYQVGGQTAGAIYRFNSNKDSFLNLNSSGAEFQGIGKEHPDDKNLGAYDIIATLATLASHFE